MLKKLQIYYIIFITTAICSANAQTTIYSESFESNSFNTNYVMNRFNDGGQDYFGVVDSWGNIKYLGTNAANPFTFQMTNLDGTQCVAAEDLKREDNPLNTNLDDYRGYFIAKTVDASAYTSVEVHILLGTRDPGTFGTFEANDNDAVRIQYAFDSDIADGANNLTPGLTAESTVNTGNYTDIGRFLASAPTQGSVMQDTDLDGTPDGPTLNNNLTEYVFTIPVTGTNLSVRIHMDYDDSAEEVAFDNLRLIAFNNAAVSENSFGAAFLSYPNPTKGDFTVNLGKTYNDITVSIRNILGQLIATNTYTTARKIDLNIDNKAGTYFVQIQNKEGQNTYLKVIKK